MRKKPKPQNRKLKISPASATAARKLALGLGLIWALPFFVALHGVLYRRIFGIDSI
jgi:hypothetical protein